MVVLKNFKVVMPYLRRNGHIIKGQQKWDRKKRAGGVEAQPMSCDTAVLNAHNLSKKSKEEAVLIFKWLHNLSNTSISEVEIIYFCETNPLPRWHVVGGAYSRFLMSEEKVAVIIITPKQSYWLSS